MHSFIGLVFILLSVLALITGVVFLVVGLFKNNKTKALWGLIIAVIGIAAYLLTTQWIWQKEGNTIATHQLVGVYTIEKVSPEWGLDTSVVRINVLELKMDSTYFLKDTVELGIAHAGRWMYEKNMPGKELCFIWASGEKSIYMDKQDLGTRIVFYKEMEKAPTHLVWVKK